MRRLLAILGLLTLVPGALGAQAARVLTEENLRAEPNGTLLGQAREGTVLAVDAVSGDWVEFTLEGWVWARSLRTIDRDGFDLVVSVDGGENLRAAPSGTILGRLEDGTLLDELERVPGWIRVRRSMFIWSESVELGDLEGAGEERSAPATPPAEERFRTAGPSGLAVLSAPDGDTLVRVRSGTDVQILAREGSWARVRVEGWSWLPEEGEQAEAPVLTDVGPTEVSNNPETYRGRLVEWNLQFVSLERAESVRTDFYEGEPFLLTRTVDGNQGLFVYVAVPPERLAEVEDLTALQRIRVLGRIRAGAARLTGSPIVDLLELEDPSGG